MNAKTAIKELTKLLSKFNSQSQNFELIETKLVDGTIVFVNYETKEILVVGADGEKVPAPVGEHELETGDIVIVTEEGKISEVKKKEDEAKVEVEIEASEEEAKPEAAKPEEEKIVEKVVSKVMEKLSAIEEKVNKVEEEFKKMKESQMTIVETQKMSAIVLQELSKDSSSTPIQQPNNFRAQLAKEKQSSIGSLQKILQSRK
jgi:hypothetical protein